jgi:hypothetical protein
VVSPNIPVPSSGDGGSGQIVVQQSRPTSGQGECINMLVSMCIEGPAPGQSLWQDRGAYP